MDYALLGLNPVNDNEPAGKNIRDEIIYDELQAELDKYNSPSIRDQFDWKNVIGPAAIILKSYSKDLLVACHLGIALTNSHKEQGLKWSVGLMKNIIEGFWDDLFPVKKRFRGRIAAISYWIDQTELAFTEAPIKKIKPEDSDEILKTLDDTRELLESRKDDLKTDNLEELFDFSSLASQISNNTEEEPAQTVEKIEEKQRINDEPVIEVSPDTGAEPEVESNDPDAMDSSEIKAYLSRKFQDIKHLCKKLRLENSSDPMPYKWARMCIWDLIETLPPENEGKTIIQAPPQHSLSVLKGLYKTGDWEKLLEQAEIKITNPQYMFCIDISRYTAEALTNMGKKFEKAAAAVCGEVLSLVSRFPDIVDYEFSKGEPFACPDTKLWIEELQRAGGDNIEGQMVLSEEDSEETERLNELINTAKNAEQMAESIAEIQTLIKSCGSMKKAFVSRIGLINVLINNKKINAAFPHLEKVLKEIEEFKLEKWEPGLALSGFLLAVKIFNLADKKDYTDRITAIVDKMALIDTKVALNYMPN